MILPPISQIGHHQKVTNITMSPISLSPTSLSSTSPLGGVNPENSLCKNHKLIGRIRDFFAIKKSASISVDFQPSKVKPLLEFY